jgi:apolipoprotein N-acyltransferase
MVMKRSALYLLPCASAVLVALSFAPFGYGFLAWLGLSSLLCALRKGGALSAAGCASLFGWLFGFGTFCWLDKIAAVNVANILIMVLYLSLYYAVFGLLYHFLSKRFQGWMIIAAPALWVSLEFLRANLSFLSVPWNFLGHTQYASPLFIQIAGITGVYGVSFVVVMANDLLSCLPDVFASSRPAVLSETRMPRWSWKVQFVTVALAVGCVLVYGWLHLEGPQNAKQIRVALVQANVLVRAGMEPREQLEHLAAYEQLTKEAAETRPDLIVWPASSLPAPISASRVVNFTLERLTRETETYLLVGGAGYDKVKPRKESFLPYSNSEFLISPAGRVAAQYDKILLVPFNEYLPLAGIITWPRWVTTIKEDFLAGSSYTLFQVGEAKFGTPVCWENLFADFFRRFVREGANLMVSVTNEGFFGVSAAPYQTLAMTVFRAVENRVAIARAAPTGISAFIAPNGVIVERVRGANGKDLFVSGFLVRDVPLSDRKTFYTMHGDIFAYACIVIAAFFIIGALIPLGVKKRALA